MVKSFERNIVKWCLVHKSAKVSSTIYRIGEIIVLEVLHRKGCKALRLCNWVNITIKNVPTVYLNIENYVMQ